MKYLTINDYTDQFAAITDCLNAALELHQSFEKEVALDSKDKKRAVFLLLGSAIDASFLGFEFYQKRQFASLLHLHRHVIEVRALVEYFIVDDSEIESWFNGSFVSGRLTARTREKLRPVIPRKSQIPFHFPDEKDLLESEKRRQEFFNQLSEHCHPTYLAVSMGFSPDDRALRQKPELDYKFGTHFLSVVLTLVSDAGRTVFTESAKHNEIDFLRLSEFRVMMNEKGF